MNVEDGEPIATLRRELGLGLDVWYLRLYYSVDYVKGAAGKPKYPLARETHGTTQFGPLWQLHPNQGVFNREELDETFSALGRLLFSSERTAYDCDPQLRDSLRQFVEHWQTRRPLQAAH